MIIVLALFFTHEAPDNSAGMAFHIGGGAILGLFLLWRVVRRFIRGFTEKPEQPVGYNIAANVVLWGFLCSIIVVVISGYLLPWTLGSPLDVYGLAIPSPLPEMLWLHELMDSLHNIAGHLFLPLMLLHILGVLKHAIIDKDDVPGRMFKAVKRGR